MEHSRARIVHTVAKYCTCALHMSQRGLPRTPCVCNCENVCFVRSLARQTAVRTIMPGARSHNALRTIVGIPLSGLEWFIHVDQLFLTERLTDQSTARARERSAVFISFASSLDIERKRLSQLLLGAAVIPRSSEEHGVIVVGNVSAGSNRSGLLVARSRLITIYSSANRDCIRLHSHANAPSRFPSLGDQ